MARCGAEKKHAGATKLCSTSSSMSVCQTNGATVSKSSPGAAVCTSAALSHHDRALGGVPCGPAQTRRASSSPLVEAIFRANAQMCKCANVRVRP
jgi:hypothetical protein